jgi:RimJ/RimL family protein N-acetyltransferase
MVAPTEFETGRLVLRQWRDADRDPFATLCADPRVMKFFISSVHDRTTADLRIDKWSRRIQEAGWGFWAVELKKASVFIGFAGFQVPAEDHPCMPCVEIGWRLAHAHWGNGYATEAASGALRVAFETFSMSEIIATTAVGNLRSSAVMQRIGMRGPEAVFRFPDVPETNPLGQHVLYRITRREWQAPNDA